MQKGKNIILPLAPALTPITSKNPLQKLSTSDMEIQLIVKCKLLKSLYCHSASKISLRQVKYEGGTVVVECSETNSRGQFDKQITLQTQANKDDHIVVYPFRVNFKKEEEDLSLSISKQIINFDLFAVHKSRFVKNEKLEQVIQNRGEEWGPLSMDKSQRIMLQPQHTNFPMIGIWISSHQPLANSCNLIKLINFVTEKSNKKCFFTLQGRKFFYMVKLNFDKNVPELFLIQWKTLGQAQKCIPVCKKDAYTKVEITLTSDEQATLQFTLRSDQKVPQPLMNIACSPIKFPSSPQQTTRSSMPDSPRFRLDHSELLQQECASLKRLAKEQEIQINDLRAEVLRLTGQLRHCKRHRHHCDSQQFTSSMSSFRQNGDNKCKRLTKSDLNYEQSAVNNCQQREGKVLEEWERFQIVQPQ